MVRTETGHRQHASTPCMHRCEEERLNVGNVGRAFHRKRRRQQRGGGGGGDVQGSDFSHRIPACNRYALRFDRMITGSPLGDRSMSTTTLVVTSAAAGHPWRGEVGNHQCQ